MAARSDAATATEPAAVGGDARPLGWQPLDRWIFVFMAAFILATVLVGFVPASLGKIAAVEARQRPPFPPLLHVHAVLMGAWVLLLLAQTGLVAGSRRALHRKFGVVAVVLMPAMVVTGMLLVLGTFRAVWGIDPARVPGDVIAGLKAGIADLALWQLRAGIVFAALASWALLLRTKDPATHKRLLILATLTLLPAATDRISWLPAAHPFSMDFYLLLSALPLFAYDLLRYGRVPRAYLLWMGLFLPLTIPVYLLHDSPWWLATAPKVMGVVD